MRSLTTLMWISWVISACTVDLGPTDSSEEASSDGGQTTSCTAPRGAYQASYREVSGGSCGTQADGTIVFDGSTEVSTGCSGEHAMASGCQDTFQITCQDGTGQITRRSGTLTWTSDGTKAQGSLKLSVSTLVTDSSGAAIDEQAVCTSSYTVAYVKL